MTTEQESIITFRDVRGYELKGLQQESFSCFNGDVRIDKYIVTVEKIKEDPEVYKNRLQLLWDYSKNHHDSLPLLNKAKEIGYILKNHRGTKAK